MIATIYGYEQWWPFSLCLIRVFLKPPPIVSRVPASLAGSIVRWKMADLLRADNGQSERRFRYNERSDDNIRMMAVA